MLVILVTLGFYSRIPAARQQPPSLFFFSMGAGFMLLETQVISRLALYFGTTWQVNGVVISILLTALLVANKVVGYFPNSLSRVWIVVPLLAGLLVAYGLPFSRLPGEPALVGAMVAIVFAVPVVFAGLLFSLEFREESSPGAALGANVLGAVVGGLLENLSFLLGCGRFCQSPLRSTLLLQSPSGCGTALAWPSRTITRIPGRCIRIHPIELESQS